MKLRLRTPDGGTTRFEAEGSETLQAVIDRLKTMLPAEVFTSTCGISLNKKEVVFPLSSFAVQCPDLTCLFLSRCSTSRELLKHAASGELSSATTSCPAVLT
eukprot:2914712-Rhodomonas_salina.1